MLWPKGSQRLTSMALTKNVLKCGKNISQKTSYLHLPPLKFKIARIKSLIGNGMFWIMFDKRCWEEKRGSPEIHIWHMSQKNVCSYDLCLGTSRFNMAGCANNYTTFSSFLISLLSLLCLSCFVLVSPLQSLLLPPLVLAVSLRIYPGLLSRTIWIQL